LPAGPSSVAEQQRIANCLGSLDELIAAQDRRVGALRAHKNGLLLELLPREGETQPRLRFPEFRDAPKWSSESLGRIAQNLDNRRIPIASDERASGEIPYYGASGIVDYVKDFIFDEELLCVSEDGANLITRTYPIAFSISGKTWVNNHAHVLRFSDAGTQKYVEIYLNALKLDDFITGIAQPKLNRSMLDSIPIRLPDILERQRIADCLASLDAYMAATARELNILKTLRLGLMQQLFPVAGETA
jgi:type I restriction enzyme S subunit